MSETKRISLETIDHNLDGGNMSGIVPKLIYGYKEDVDVWPAEPAPTVGQGGAVTPMTMAAAGALVGDVVMKTGTKAFELDFTEDVGNLKIATVGETDGHHVEYDLSITKAKIASKIFGFMNAAIDRKMFFIVEDENGIRYLLGNSRRGAQLVPGESATTGTTGSDRNQVALQFKFRDRKAYTYEGDTEDILITVS